MDIRPSPKRDVPVHIWSQFRQHYSAEYKYTIWPTIHSEKNTNRTIGTDIVKNALVYLMSNNNHTKYVLGICQLNINHNNWNIW